MGEADADTEQVKNYLAVFKHPPGNCDWANPEIEGHFITSPVRGVSVWDIKLSQFLGQLPPPICISCKAAYVLDSVQLD